MELTFNKYQEGALETWTGEDKLLRTILGICGEAGEVAEAMKKYLRGDYSKEVLTEMLKKELGDVLYYIGVCAHEFGIKLDDIATTNYNKLKSRKERNVIQGSGDER